MCSKPKVQYVEVPAETQQVATPTYADASVTKASTNTRTKAASTANRNIATSARGLTDEATTDKEKKGLLGE